MTKDQQRIALIVGLLLVAAVAYFSVSSLTDTKRGEGTKSLSVLLEVPLPNAQIASGTLDCGVSKQATGYLAEKNVEALCDIFEKNNKILEPVEVCSSLKENEKKLTLEGFWDDTVVNTNFSSECHSELWRVIKPFDFEN